MPIFKGGESTDWPKEVFSQFHGCHYGLYTMRGIRTGTHRYIYHPLGLDELYDEEADPWELHNLAEREEAAPILREMKERMVAWMERSGDVMFYWNGVRPPPRRPSRPGKRMAGMAETVRRRRTKGGKDSAGEIQSPGDDS